MQPRDEHRPPAARQPEWGWASLPAQEANLEPSAEIGCPTGRALRMQRLASGQAVYTLRAGRRPPAVHGGRDGGPPRPETQASLEQLLVPQHLWLYPGSPNSQSKTQRLTNEWMASTASEEPLAAAVICS